jgi:hypothetical protein
MLFQKPVRKTKNPAEISGFTEQRNFKKLLNSHCIYAVKKFQGLKKFHSVNYRAEKF